VAANVPVCSAFKFETPAGRVNKTKNQSDKGRTA